MPDPGVRVRRPSALVRFVIVVLTLCGLIVTTAPAASAGLHRPVSRTDANDTRSPLDLRWLKLVHLGPRFDQLWFSTWGPVTKTELDPKTHGNFAMGIDLNNDPRRYERWIYVDVVGGALRGTVFNPSTGGVMRTPAARVSPREFRVDVPLGALGRPASYRFALFSTYHATPCRKHFRACNDSIPSRRPLILQDLRPPAIVWKPGPIFSSNAGAGLTYPAAFTAHDDTLGSGLRHWTLQKEPFGKNSWKDVQGGSTAGSHTVNVAGKAGKAYHLRVVASDRAGNGRISGLRTLIFPFDDVSATYAGTWTQSTGSSTAYLGTTSSSSTLGDTATLGFKGTQLCVLGASVASASAATVAIDSAVEAPLSESSATPDRALLQCYAVSQGSHTVVITVSGGPDAFVIDGFVVVP